jgi:hypothetical protein
VERIRVRVAMHSGDVPRDPYPIHGEATVLACRLLDATILRSCLDATEQPLAAIVSQTIYENIVKQAYPPIDPLAWHPAVAATKEGPKPAWVHVPGDVDAPRRAGSWWRSGATRPDAAPAGGEVSTSPRSSPGHGGADAALQGSDVYQSSKRRSRSKLSPGATRPKQAQGDLIAMNSLVSSPWRRSSPEMC